MAAIVADRARSGPVRTLPSVRAEITAVVTVVAAFVLAQLVDRAVSRRAEELASSVPHGGTAAAGTRLRVLRRLVYALILFVGIALALSQFEGVRRVATGMLASSAVLGLVVGFAARATLANAVAGVLIAITQPIRIGDSVTFEGATGTVEDIRLTYTYIACDDGTRVIVPNERLAQNTVENHTIGTGPVRVEVPLYLPPGADVVRALAVLGREDGVDVRVAEVEKDGIRIVAGATAPSRAERASVEAGLTVACLERLQREGLSSTGPDRAPSRDDSPAEKAT
jgi:small-conductance mechanosensitive channel